MGLPKKRLQPGWALRPKELQAATKVMWDEGVLLTARLPLMGKPFRIAPLGERYPLLQVLQYYRMFKILACVSCMYHPYLADRCPHCSVTYTPWKSHSTAPLPLVKYPRLQNTSVKGGYDTAKVAPASLCRMVGLQLEKYSAPKRPKPLTPENLEPQLLKHKP